MYGWCVGLRKVHSPYAHQPTGARSAASGLTRVVGGSGRSRPPWLAAVSYFGVAWPPPCDRGLGVRQAGERLRGRAHPADSSEAARMSDQPGCDGSVTMPQNSGACHLPATTLNANGRSATKLI